MGAPQYEQAGADISGTGTTNTIPRWTGPSTLGDSVITQSGSNIGFGLGANTPISRWHALVPNSGASPTTSDWTGSFSANGDYRSGFGFQFSAGAAASNRVTCLVSNGTATGQTVVWTADGTGNVGIGTASPLGYANFVALNIGDNNAAKTGLLKFRSTYNAGNGAELYQATDGRVILNADGTGTTAAILDPTNKLLNIAPASGWGLKLPATPGNADTQTLDCYQENPLATTAGNGWTPTLSAAATWGGTQPNVTYARYVRMGSMVFCEVKLTMGAGTMTSTYGTTTIDSPFTTNTNASHAAVPVAAPGASGVGFQTGTTVYLPTIGASSTFILTWSFFA